MPIVIKLEGGYNLRDLGELPSSTGKATKRGVFVRAGNLDKLSKAAQSQFIDYGLKTVIDLRSEWECQNYPNVFAQSSHVQYKNLPMMNDDLSNNPEFKAKTEHCPNLSEVYRVYLDTCQQPLGMIISAIADSPTTTAFHCYAGKDRTGIVAALLLSVAGVEDKVIAQDYAETNEHIRHLVAEWRENTIKNNRDLAKMERDSAAAPETILDSLTYIRQNYVGVEEYLQLCGVSSQQLQAIKASFV
jgi:protein-tyrosine phosphatase